MRTRIPFVGALLALLIASIAMFSTAQDKPKIAIKDIMEKAHKGNPALCAKVAGEKASKEEKQQLLELWSALGENKPPKGPEKSWKEKTDAMVVAAKAAVADDKGYGAKVKAAVNCKACHEVHKGK
jgi:hypothetical protein